MLTEADTESINVKRRLFDPDVVAMITQPFRIEMLIDHARVVYFPDLLLRLANGDQVVEEHKANCRQLRDADYRRKIDVAAGGLAARGIDFNVVVGDNPDEDPWARRVREIIDRNVEHMCVSRFVRYRKTDAVRVVRLLEEHGTATLGSVADLLSRHRSIGYAMAYSMTARREIAIDLHRPLDERSTVSPVARPRPPPGAVAA